jgi:hypothetical protein
MFQTGSLHMTSMTSCWLCSKVVNKFHRFFSVYNRMCIVCPLFEALLGYFFNSILRRKQTWCPRIWIIRIKHCVFRKLCMYKLWQLTHKLYIKSFGLYSVCEWAAGVYIIDNFLKNSIYPIETLLSWILSHGELYSVKNLMW